MIAVRRGQHSHATLMLALPLVLSPLSGPLARSAHRPSAVGRKGIASGTPSPARILGSRVGLLNSSRFSHDYATTEREKSEPSNESSDRKGLGWKRTPAFGFPDGPNWVQRRTAQRGSQSRAEFDLQRTGGDLVNRSLGGRDGARGSFNLQGGREAGGRAPPSHHNTHVRREADTGRRSGVVVSSKASDRPHLRPGEKFYDISRKEPARNTAGRQPDELPRWKPVSEGGRPYFKPKANYYDSRPTSRQSKGDEEETNRRAQSSEPYTRKGYQEQRNRAVKNDRGSGTLDGHTEDGPNYGYDFRKTGPKLGRFRVIRPPSGRFAGADRKGADFRGREVPGRQKAVESSGKWESLDFGRDGPPPEELKRHRPRRLEGEEKWQYAVRKKRLAGHSRGATGKRKAPIFLDEEGLGDEPQGEDWRRKKVAWLCKQIPTLRPRLVVTILNDQRTWINAEDSKYITEHLLQVNQILRAHRVLKWEMQQPWYEFDYELSSKVAAQLGQWNKLSRTRDIYDLIIRNGKVPDCATFTGLINCYIADAENPSLIQAWTLYNQMTKLGGHEPSPTLRYSLFNSLAQKGLTHLDHADAVFESIKASGLVCSTAMYNLLIHLHGTKGNKARVDVLIEEMKGTGLMVGQDVYAAILRACAKDGNVSDGEQAFADLKASGQKPVTSVYASLIKMYGKADLPEKAFQILEEMRETGRTPNLVVYETLIEIAASSGDRELAEKLLVEAEGRRLPSLHASYNALMRLYSKTGLLDELEKAFSEMGKRGYAPNIASHNILLEACMENGLLEKAEAVYEDLKASERISPNKTTYELMIKVYSKSKNTAKLKEVFKALTDRHLEIPEGADKQLRAAVSPKEMEAHRKSQLKLNRDQREILAGVLLAGARVESHDRNRTYELHFGLDPDSRVGFPLLNHLFEQFSAWATEPPSRQPLPDPTDPSKSKTLLAFQTISHGSFRFFAHQYRPDLSPAIPRLVHRWLTPRALAYWYMYGGAKCPHTGDILLNAAPYRDKEIMLVVNEMHTRSMDCEKKRTDSGLAICFSGKSAIWLWGLIEPHILLEVKDLLNPEAEQGDVNRASSMS